MMHAGCRRIIKYWRRICILWHGNCAWGAGGLSNLTMTQNIRPRRLFSVFSRKRSGVVITDLLTATSFNYFGEITLHNQNIYTTRKIHYGEFFFK